MTKPPVPPLPPLPPLPPPSSALPPGAFEVEVVAVEVVAVLGTGLLVSSQNNSEVSMPQVTTNKRQTEPMYSWNPLGNKKEHVTGSQQQRSKIALHKCKVVPLAIATCESIFMGQTPLLPLFLFIYNYYTLFSNPGTHGAWQTAGNPPFAVGFHHGP